MPFTHKTALEEIKFKIRVPVNYYFADLVCEPPPHPFIGKMFALKRYRFKRGGRAVRKFFESCCKKKFILQNVLCCNVSFSSILASAYHVHVPVVHVIGLSLVRVAVGAGQHEEDAQLEENHPGGKKRC